MHLHSPVVLNHHVGPYAVKSSHFSLQRTPWLEVWTYVSLYIYNCLISMHRIVIGGRFFELYKIRLFSSDKESTLELPGHSMIRFFFITGDGLRTCSTDYGQTEFASTSGLVGLQARRRKQPNKVHLVRLLPKLRKG